MSLVSASVMRPPSLSTIRSLAPRIAMWSRFSGAKASDVTMWSGWFFTVQTRESDTPVLPPVYSTTAPFGGSRPSASAASIMASAIRSFILPVGF
jgi:hypothetical protein